MARLAGVSVASVSFALNGQPGVADDTRQPDPGRRGPARLPGQPAGPGAAAGPHHHLRPGHPQLQQPLLPGGADRGRTGRVRRRGHLAAARLALLGRTRTPAGPGDGRPAAGRPGHRPGRQGRIAAALAGTAARHPGGSAERSGGRDPRRLPRLSRQRGRGRTRDAAAGRARALVRGVPVGAARPGGRPGPAAPFPAAGAGARRAAGRDALTAHHHRRAQGGRERCWPARTPPPRSSPTPTTPRSASTRPPATCRCRSVRTSPSSGTTTCRPRNCSIRRWRPSAWTAGKWAGR